MLFEFEEILKRLFAEVTDIEFTPMKEYRLYEGYIRWRCAHDLPLTYLYSHYARVNEHLVREWVLNYIIEQGWA